MIFFKNLLEVTSDLYDKDSALSVAPSVRVFFAAQRRKMYREPVIKRQPVIHQLLDTVFAKPTRSDGRLRCHKIQTIPFKAERDCSL